MDIGNLTLNQMREIAALVTQAQAPYAPTKPDPWKGRYVLVRCYSAGVHCGLLESHDGDQVTLTKSRRLWSWTAAGGVALSGVSVHGLKSGKVDVEVAEIRLTGAIEVIPCSDVSATSIRSFAGAK